MKQFITDDGKHIATRVSRWISVKHAYNISKRNSLYDFSTDEYGRHPYDKGYDPTNGTYLDYFTFDGRNYATEQFIALGSVWCGGAPYGITDTDGKLHFIGAVDFYGDLYDPYYIELDEYGESVRVYAIDIKR